MSSSETLNGSPDRLLQFYQLLRRLGLPRDQWPFALAIELGDIDGDVLAERPLTEEEKRRHGRGRSLVDEDGGAA